ncbi:MULTISPECIES: hypothetical protein [unclassified Natrinema]|uniref:hypothetical protein n=1 Tax=unclassified Natrinema TaxID=2622230 RepID=UPI0011AE75D3|nr:MULTISPECIES: hypothetical protein [unclassified Natrinema]
MTPNPANFTSENGDTSVTDSPVNRRNLLGVLGVATGFSTLTGTATATTQNVDCGADGRVRTRGCSDESLTGKDWSSGAVTIQACPNGVGGTATLRVTGRLGYDRYGQPQQAGGTGDGQSVQGTQSQRIVVTQGQEMSTEDGTAEQTQTVIIEQDQSMSGGGGGNLPEVEVTLQPGEKRTLWYTGSIAGFSTSNTNLNIGIANRPD